MIGGKGIQPLQDPHWVLPGKPGTISVLYCCMTRNSVGTECRRNSVLFWGRERVPLLSRWETLILGCARSTCIVLILAEMVQSLHRGFSITTITFGSVGYPGKTSLRREDFVVHKYLLSDSPIVALDFQIYHLLLQAHVWKWECTEYCVLLFLLVA